MTRLSVAVARRDLILACLGLRLGLGGTAMAADPSAIVENVAAPKAGVAVMEYLSPGRVIRLGRDDTVTLGYLRSCLRESIVGGRITVGRDQSRVEDGKVTRERVECDGGALKLGARQSGKSLVLVLRAPPPGSGTPSPTIQLYGTSPIIRLAAGFSDVRIDRLDRPADAIELTAADGIIDLALTGRSLKPGGLYRARSGARVIVFKINRFARPGAGPMIGRLILF